LSVGFGWAPPPPPPQDLLDLEALRAGRLKVIPVPTRIRELVRDCVTTVRADGTAFAPTNAIHHSPFRSVCSMSMYVIV
jgi:hypothetical protein